MKFRHIPTGIVVNSDSELPPAVYEKVDEREPKDVKDAKPAKKRKAAKER